MENPPDPPGIQVCYHLCPVINHLTSQSDQTKTLKPSIFINSGRRDLGLCPHRHQVLVSITNKGQQSPLTVLHHWDPTDLNSSIAIRANLSASGLQYVGGFQELGAFGLSETDVLDVETVHRCLTSRITRRSSESDLVASIIESLRKTADSTASGKSTQLFLISVFSGTQGPLFGRDSVPQWKWAKPENIYPRKTGSWETDVGRAVENGEFEAGRGWYLLVRERPEDEWATFEDRAVDDLAQ